MSRRTLVAVAATLLIATACRAADLPTPQAVRWTSATTGVALDVMIYTPPDADSKKSPVVVYQKNLNTPRIGQEADGPIIADLLKDGCIVLAIDYAHHDKAKSPTINADSLAIRQAITGKKPTLLADKKVDANRVYFLAEGFRLKRNVEFARDGKRVLAMDIAYPSQPTAPVPLLLEFTCDNVDRMGAGSLAFCQDTLLDGGMAAGFAVAMADHPVAPPYKGLDDPMPEAYFRARAAAVTAADFAKKHRLAESIGVIGFSRGGPFAAMLAANTGEHANPPGSTADAKSAGATAVRAALVHGNRYDYLDLLPDDKMVSRFKKAWGDPATQPANWKLRGASNYLAKDKADIAPMFLNTSRKESPEYQYGLQKFHDRLTALGVEHIYQVDDDDRGHKVSTDPATLKRIYEFFAKNLKDESK